MLDAHKTISNPKPYRVLSIDGGGIRGLYTAIFLDTLAARFSGQNNGSVYDIAKGFDLIVGTSTGAIMASALALGMSTHDIVQLYRTLGPKVFRDPVPNNKGNFFSLATWVWHHWKKPANPGNVLHDGLLPFFGDATLGEMYASRQVALCVPVTNLAIDKGYVFKTPHNPLNVRDMHYKLLDICVATTSAPILFPLTTIDDPDDKDDYKVFVDGGLWANNPVLVGLSEALSMTDSQRPIEILSLGTCSPPGGTFVAKDKVNWGLSEWRAGTRVLSLSLEAQSSAYNYLACSLSKHFKQPCSILRPSQSSPSDEQGKYMNMDQASPSALKVLSDLAKQDAEVTYRQALDAQDKQFSALRDIFANMPHK